MIRFITSLFLFLLLSTQLSAQCQYTLLLTDEFGDGWDIGLLTYDVNGVTQTATLDDIIDNGESKEITINVNTGEPIFLTWSQAFFNEEVTITLFDADANLVFTSTDPADGVIYTGTANCPSCVKVSGVYMENIYATSAKVRWNAVSNAQKYRVIYGLKGFPAGQGDTVFSNTPKVTIPGLTEMVNYSFYINTICDAADTSAVAGPFDFKTYWSDDIAVTGIDLPVSNCGLGNELISFKLTNFGANPQTLFTYGYSVNGVDAGIAPPMDGLYAGVVRKDSTITITFETGYNFSASGEYEICVYTKLNGMDDNTTNDTFCYKINNRLSLPYAQNFEDWDGGWVASSALSGGTNSWEYGEPNNTIINKAASGLNAWVTNLDGNYANGETSYLTSPCFDFSSLAPTDVPAFSCSMFLNLEDLYDGVILEMTTDGGSSWNKVGDIGQGLNWYNTTLNNGTTAWSGSTQAWVPVRQLLTGAQGQSTVQLRFAFESDFSASLEGIGVDNIQIAVPKPKDLAVVAASTLGENNDCGLASDSIRISVANFGTQAQNAYSITYSINGGNPVTQNINQPLAPDQVRVFTFATPFNSSSTNFDILLSVNLSGDQVSINNSLNYSVDHSPYSVPFVEQFENGLPQGWQVQPGTAINSGHGNVSNVLAFNLFDFQPSFEQITPAFGPLSAADSLTYQYRVVDFNTELGIPLGSNKMTVQISTDCGANFTTIDLVNNANHTPTTLMTTRVVNLSAFAGKTVKFRFLGDWTAGDFYIDLDNIGVRAMSVAVDDFSSFERLQVYPNPTSGFVTVAGELKSATALQLDVYNILGERSITLPIAQTDRFLENLDMSAMSPGIYFLRISDGSTQRTIKIIKE